MQVGRGGENRKANRKGPEARLKGRVPDPTPRNRKVGVEGSKRVQGLHLERLEVRAKLGLTDALRSRS